jgi:N-methylhydantoinase A
VTTRRSVELRYRGQTHSVEIPFDNVKSVVDLKARFIEGYKARYGHADAVNAVEMVGVRSGASAELLRPDLERLNPAADTSGKVSSTTRQVYFAGPKRKLDTQVFKRSALPVGFAASGPILIEEYGSTTLVGPQDRFQIGRLGEIRIHIAPKS